MTFTNYSIITKTIHDLEEPKKRRSRKRRKSRTRILDSMPNNHDHFNDNKHDTLFTFFYCPCNYQIHTIPALQNKSKNHILLPFTTTSKSNFFYFSFTSFLAKDFSLLRLCNNTSFQYGSSTAELSGGVKSFLDFIQLSLLYKPYSPFQRVRATTN